MSWEPNQPPERSGEPGPYGQQYPDAYKQPGSFDTPGYRQHGPYGYTPQRPQPLGQAIQELPTQYVKILTKPGAQSFLAEQGKADWRVIWAQLLFLGLLGSIIGFLQNAAIVPANSFAASLETFARFSIITVPLSLLITVGIQYLLARALRGNGTYKTQAYNQLLFTVPLTIVAYIFQLIPLIGAILGALVGIYQIVLNVYAVMATHRLSGGKATLAVLLPVIVLIVLAMLVLIVLAMQHVALTNL